MATGRPVGTMFVELALDSTKYTKGQKEILAGAEQNSADIEKTFKRVGVTSDKMYDAMRQNITNSLEAIKRSHLTTADERVRAEQAAATKIQNINQQQFGTHTSLLDSIKKNYVAASAAIVVAWMAVNKAISYMDQGAKAMQVESSFKIMAESAGASADSMIANIKRATRETIDDSDLMVKAVKLMTLGYNPEQIERFSKVVITSSQIMGVTAGEAYERLSDALATRMPKALVIAGAVTRDQMKVVQSAVTAGVDSMALYELAMANLEYKQKMLQGTQDEATISLQRFHAQQKETTEAIGIGLIVAVQKLYGVFQAAASGATYMVGGLFKLVAAASWLQSKLPGYIGEQGKKDYESASALAAAAFASAADLDKKAQDNIKGRAEVDARATKDEIANAKARVDAQMKVLKSAVDAAAAAKKLAALSDQWKEMQRTLQGKTETDGLDKWEKKLTDIRVEAEKLIDKFKSIPGAVSVIKDWRASAERGVETERAAELGNAAVKIEAETQNRRLAEQTAAANEYEKIVTEAADYSINENDRAINKIIADENKKLGALATLYANSYEGFGITRAEYEKAADGVVAQSEAMRSVQAEKELSDKLNFYSTITSYEDTYYAKKFAWIDEEGKRLGKFYKDEAAGAAWAAQQKAKLSGEAFYKENADRQQAFSSIKNNFSMMAELYAEDSKERKVLSELSKAAAIAELAIQAQKNIMIAVGAVAQQGTGDPYSAFARIAAMIAVMSSVLGMAGLAFGGGGGGASAAPVLPASTVLGAEAGTGSESASKSYELLKDTYTLEYRELTGIHDSMKELNANITGLVTSIVRTGGVGSFTSAPGSTSGWEQQLQTSIDKPFLSLMSGDPIGKAITGFISKWGGKLVGSIFGGGSSSSVDSSGIQFGGSSVSGLLAGGGMGAQQYAHITTEHSGGWFHSDWTSGETQYKALDTQVTDMLNATFKSIGTTLVELAKGLGTGTQAALAYVFAETKIDLQGKSTDDINKAISEFISNTADTAVEALFGSMLRGYQQLDEGLLETAVRLLRDKAVIMDTLAMTGKAFTGTIPQIIAFSEAIIGMAGDLDTLTKAAGTYYDKFFTDAEKQARLQGQLAGALGDAGYALPGSRGGYRALVEGLDLTTTAGQQAYVMLMNFAEAADQYYSVVEDATTGTNSLTEALKRQSETVQKWLADLNKSTLAPVMSAQAQEAAYASARGAAFSSGATEANTSAFLTAASDYLKFARAYSGDYSSIYQMVTGDVQSLADAIALALTQTNLPAHAGGGLMTRPSIGGEAGSEWAVPTYEPQRSRFLESAPPQFWENLKGAGVVQPGGGGDITIRLVNVLDGKVLSDSVAKHIPRNQNLTEAIRRVN